MLTGVGSSSIHTNLLQAGSARSKAIQHLASGKAINRASEDVAGSSMLAAFESQTRSLSQMMSNQQSQSNLLQTASGSLSSTSDILQNINDLALQASNGTLTDDDRAAIQQQIDQLSSQITDGANQAQFNGQNLLDGSFSTTLQNGDKLSIGSMTAEGLGIDKLSVATQADAMAATQQIASAMNKVVSTQGNLGSAINGISSSLNNLNNQYMNGLSAQSSIGDVDFANEVMNLTLSRMQSQASLSVFNMNNESRSNVLRLLSE